jgi:hypothetical protein
MNPDCQPQLSQIDGGVLAERGLAEFGCATSNNPALCLLSGPGHPGFNIALPYPEVSR